MNKEFIMNKLKETKQYIEDELGHKVAYICVYGSQNYNLDLYTEDYQSDLDMKAVIVPTLNDLVKNSKPVSKVIEIPTGQCDIKDIRKYFETLLKGNPAYVETIFTEYYIVDSDFEIEFEDIFNNRESLVKALSIPMINAMYGMMLEKRKALTHPYPSIKHKIDKWGYDGKQAHHIVRLYMMMFRYFSKEKPLNSCFKFSKEIIGYTFIQDLKLNNYYTLEKAVYLSDDYIRLGKDLKEKTLEELKEDKTIDYSWKGYYLQLSQEIIIKSIKRNMTLTA